MDIKHYLIETEKRYYLRLKTIVPLNDELMDKIEMMVAKYNPLSISRPSKTIMHRQPLDFPNVDCAEVYIVDMTFGLPATPQVLRADIRKVLDAPENFVFIRNQKEPGELQIEIMNAISDIETEADEKGLIPHSLLDDPDYNESETEHPGLFGASYNSALLGYLSDIEKERKDAVQKVKSAPFSWLDLPDRKDQEPVQDDTDFNAHLKDLEKFPPSKEKSANVDVSIFGDIDSTAQTVRKVYKNSKGEKIVLTRKLSGEK